MRSFNSIELTLLALSALSFVAGVNAAATRAAVTLATRLQCVAARLCARIAFAAPPFPHV